MQFEVYCDEAHPEVLTSTNASAQYLMIGSLWLPSEIRPEVKTKITTLREQHNTWGEIKWNKVSPNRLPFYLALIDLFFGYASELRFRCIAVEKDSVNMSLHQGDGELGFYKFYYQLLHHWILDFNEYRIFCDAKTNRDPTRLLTLERCLDNANLSSSITSVQSLPSREVVLIQMADLLLGAASARLNNTLREGSAKEALVQRLESRQNKMIAPTVKGEEKFNVFRIRLQGGW